MPEPGEGLPAEVVIPPVEGIGSIDWDLFPREIFPVATAFAARVVKEPKYAEAYNMFKAVTKAEDQLKITRKQILNMRNIPPKEEDPDIEKRWSDESIERHNQELEEQSRKQQEEVAVLHEKLRTKNQSQEFADLYDDLSEKIRGITSASLKGTTKDPDYIANPLTQGVFNSYAITLIEYNLAILRKKI